MTMKMKFTHIIITDVDPLFTVKQKKIMFVL
jgi:hypothetical protein